MKKNLLTFIMVLSAIFVNAQTETEPNGNFAQADTLTFGNCISETIDPAGDKDFFIIQVSQGGTLEINLNNLPTNFAAQIDLYNSAHTLLYNGSYPTNTLNVGWQFIVCPDIYYFKITDYWGAQITTPTMLCVNLDTVDNCECNQTFASACVIPVDTCITEKIYGFDPVFLNNEDVDYYKITIAQAGVLEINLNGFPNPLAARINFYNSSQTLLYNGSYPINTPNVGWQFVVAPGTYYIKFDDYWGGQDTGAFTFCTHLDVTDNCEFNQSFATACVIPIDTCVTEKIYGWDATLNRRDVDYYKITVPQSGILEITLNGLPGPIAAQINVYNSNQVLRYNGSYPINTPNVGWQFLVIPGTYYIEFDDYWGGQDSNAFTFCTHLDSAEACEFNETFATACDIPVDTCLAEKIYGWDVTINHTDVDFYKITVPQAGTLEINLNGLPPAIAAQINFYNSSQGLLYNGSFPVNTPNASWQFLVHTGIYYIKFDDYWGGQDSNAFTFCTHLDVTDNCEFNQSFITACAIPLDTCLTEKIYGWDPTLNHTDVDYYKVTIPQAGTLEISLNGLPPAIAPQINFYNSGLGLLYNGSYPINTPDVGWQFLVCPGTYYIKFDDYWGAQDSGAFTFCTHLDVTDSCECNGDYSNACFKPEVTCFTEKIYGWDASINQTEKDYYRVSASLTGTFFVNVSNIPAAISLQLCVRDSFNTNACIINPVNPVNTPNANWSFNTIANHTYYLIFDNYTGASDSGSFTTCFDINVGIEQLSSNSQFSITPNPAATQLQIELKDPAAKNCIVEISNVVGETILETKSVNTQAITLDISKLSPGIYFVKLQTEKGNSIQKLIKE